MGNNIKKKIDSFFANYPLKEFDKGTILIFASNNPRGVFYLESGQVRQYDITSTGQEVVVNVFKPTSFFPVSCMLNKTANKYFFESFTKVSVRIAPDKAVLQFLEENSDVTLDLLKRIYVGVDGMKRRMAYMMGGSTRNRVLFELILECKRFGAQQTDGSYVLSMHESELAARSGLARETISRHLSKLNTGQLMTINHKEIIIKNLKQLEDELGEGVA